jgi:hypothetical protein
LGVVESRLTANSQKRAREVTNVFEVENSLTAVGEGQEEAIE